MHPVLDYLTHVLPQRPGFRHNPVQVAYARVLIDGVKAQGKVHFIEGDTGIGKSLAYQLVLADWVAKGKYMGGKQAARRAVISTHSRILQRQLLQPDNLAIVRDYLTRQGLPDLTFQLRMGRENYLSPERLALQLGAISLEAAASDRHLPEPQRRLARWALESDGCLLDLDPAWLPEGWQLSELALRRDDPLPEALEAQLDAAVESDILVINHALLVMDLMTQGSVTQVVSPYALLIDEAEHYPELAEELLSQRISLQSAARLLRQLKQPAAVEWEALQETLTDPARAGTAHGVTADESEKLQAAIESLLKRRPRESAHDPVLWREWLHLRRSAETIATRLREASRHLVLDYSPVRGLPGIVAHSPSAASSLRNGAAGRATLLTSATLSDLDHAPGETPQFRYMRSRLQLPVTSKRSGLQASFQAKQFGELRFRLPLGLPHPIAQLPSGGGYRLSADYVKRVLPYLHDQPGRTLVLCASYADVEALSAAWPEAQRHRLVAHRAGQGLSELVARLEAESILLTPAGWEGLSPDRQGDTAFWSHLVVLRNPRPARSAVEHRLVEQLLQRHGMGGDQASAIAKGMLHRKSTVRTLHKLRQGLGRAIRHPDDQVLVTLLEPRFPRPSGAPPQAGLRQSTALLGAIPARFRAAWQRAEEPLMGGPHSQALPPPRDSLSALL